MYILLIIIIFDLKPNIMKLLNRLKENYKEKLKNDSTALGRKVFNTLDTKSLWIDLTIDECINISLILLNTSIVDINEISNLFE